MYLYKMLSFNYSDSSNVVNLFIVFSKNFCTKSSFCHPNQLHCPVSILYIIYSRFRLTVPILCVSMCINMFTAHVSLFSRGAYSSGAFLYYIHTQHIHILSEIYHAYALTHTPTSRRIAQAQWVFSSVRFHSPSRVRASYSCVLSVISRVSCGAVLQQKFIYCILSLIHAQIHGTFVFYGSFIFPHKAAQVHSIVKFTIKNYCIHSYTKYACVNIP